MITAEEARSLMELDTIVQRQLDLIDTLIKYGFNISHITFDLGEGIFVPLSKRKAFKRFKKRMNSSKDKIKAFREEMKVGKYCYEVFFRR